MPLGNALRDFPKSVCCWCASRNPLVGFSSFWYSEKILRNGDVSRDTIYKRPTSRKLRRICLTDELKSHYDVVIIGAGLAGLSLSAQLLKYTDKSVLLLDKWDDPPRPTQKVGESLVQLSGYYFSKIL